eukprot:TRINITY_DN1039_c0_g1_i8.p1 TRINITY_DN1039_c0_g1~~TRINITY_DN1039_c0_g1_i8.p1  ORF type:complete len:1098 (+),score=312.22 TRINITY_DN1039_c0_g1_i8:94-3387(+)
MLGIRCLSISLSLALVVITGGVIGGLSITTGNRVTDQTKATGQRGLEATHKVCNNGFDSLSVAQQEGMQACFSSGRDNAEYLGGLLLEQVKQVVTTKMKNLLDAPLQALQQVYNTLATIPPEQLNEGRMWDEAHSRWMNHIFRAAHQRGVTSLQVAYNPRQLKDGFPVRKLRFYIEHPVTVGRGRDEYHQLMMASDMTFACYPGNTLGRAECAANRCIWCSSNAGGAGYCGNPKRIEGELSADSTWAPCKAGYTAAVGANVPKPMYAARKPTQDSYTGIADETGNLYIGSCGLDGQDEKCGCEAQSDFQFKLMRNNGTVKGWPLGRPPRTGTQEPYQAFPRIGRYRRPDGTYPARLTTDPDAVLEPGACPIPADLAAAHALSARQNGQVDRIGYTRWAPMGVGPPSPLLALGVYKSWTHSSMPLQNGKAHYMGYVSAAIDGRAFTTFMRNVDLPPESRMYAVQANPWRSAPNKCEDDFHGLLEIMGMTCKTLQAIMNVLGLTCDSDLRALAPSLLAKENYIWDHCPESCGRCPWSLAESVGELVGATHGDAYRTLPLEGSSYESSGIHDLRALHVFNSSDETIRKHAKWVMDKPSHYEGFPEGQIVPWTDDEGRLWWTKYSIITMPSELELLKIYLVILVQRDQAMRAIDAATRIVQENITRQTAAVLAEVAEQRSETAAVIERENKETEDQKELDFTVMYIIVAVCVAILMVVSVIFVHFTIAPLLVLECEMADVATMKLENIDRDRPLSHLGEVARMQRSFLQMVSNLIEYRNYMPQSILCDDEGDEELDGECATSQVSLAERAASDPDPKSGQSSSGSRRSTATASRADAAQKRLAAASDELKKRQVSFAAFNISGMHELLSGTSETMAACHSDYLSRAIAQILAHKGIPDTFCGDRILGSFNGVKQCATHRAQAAQCAATFAPEVGTTAAVVSGDCKFGNMGCTGAKRFTFVGGAYTWAWALERFCAFVGTGVLCDKWICGEAQNSLYVRVIAAVAFPKRHAQDLVVHQLLGKKTVGEDEWMYQMEEAAANDPYQTWNRAIQCAIDGHFGEADEALQEFKRAPTGDALPVAVVDMCADAIQLQKYTATKLAFH